MMASARHRRHFCKPDGDGGVVTLPGISLADHSIFFWFDRCPSWIAPRTPICAALEKSDPSGPCGQCPKLGTCRRRTSLLRSKVEARRERVGGSLRICSETRSLV